MNTRTRTKTSTTTKKTDSSTQSKATNALILKDLPLEIVTPEQYESITRANYYHPESRLILELFLQTNYLWQLARKIQHKPESIASINWSSIERSTGKLISQSLSKLLTGIDNKPWNQDLPAPPVLASKPTKKTKTAQQKQACGCSTKHSDAADVVEACQLGKAQGSDESWTGY